MAATLETEKSGRVMCVRIDNPPHNFMNRGMVRELDELTRSLGRDRSVGAVVFTGRPEGLFITHYDVAEILAGAEDVGMEVGPRAAGASLGAVRGLSRLPGVRGAIERSPARGTAELNRLHDMFLRMNRLDKVFIAAINGPALGGGCEFSLACDLRYIGADAGPIGQPEMTVGFPPGGGGTQRLARLLGTGRALELILEAPALPPKEALEIGLVHRVTKAGRVLEEAMTTAERLARRAPESVAGAKRAVYEGAAFPLTAGLATERKWFMSTVSKPAAKRAMRAYAEQVASGTTWQDAEALRPWQEGTAVDIVE